MSKSVCMKRNLAAVAVFIIFVDGGFASATQEALKAIEHMNTLLLHQSALDCEDISRAYEAKGMMPSSGAYYLYKYSSYVYCKFESQKSEPNGGPNSWTVILRDFAKKDHRNSIVFNARLSDEDSSGNFESEFKMGARILREMLGGSSGGRNYQVVINAVDVETGKTWRLAYDYVYFNKTDLFYGDLMEKTSPENSVDTTPDKHLQLKDRLDSPKSFKEVSREFGRTVNMQVMVKPNPSLNQ